MNKPSYYRCTACNVDVATVDIIVSVGGGMFHECGSTLTEIPESWDSPKGQPRRHSVAETITNTAVGFGVSLSLQYLVFPLYGFHASHAQHLGIITAFTVASLVRGYVIRRIFNRVRHD